uniref:hypothetical protein n=1 Tax=Oceanicoccus sp. KOV_DT_Chl TaxID=1904639 RepID=UPI001F170444
MLFQVDNEWLHLLAWPEIGPGIFGFALNDKSLINQCAQLFQEIISQQITIKKWARNYAKIYLQQLLIRCYQTLPDDSTKTIDPRIKKAINFISQHYRSHFSIESLAE